MQPGVKITSSTKQKDELILEGNDVELVSRSGKIDAEFSKALEKRRCLHSVSFSFQLHWSKCQRQWRIKIFVNFLTVFTLAKSSLLTKLRSRARLFLWSLKRNSSCHVVFSSLCVLMRVLPNKDKRIEPEREKERKNPRPHTHTHTYRKTVITWLPFCFAFISTSDNTHDTSVIDERWTRLRWIWYQMLTLISSRMKIIPSTNNSFGVSKRTKMGESTSADWFNCWKKSAWKRPTRNAAIQHV